VDARAATCRSEQLQSNQLRSNQSAASHRSEHLEGNLRERTTHMGRGNPEERGPSVAGTWLRRRSALHTAGGVAAIALVGAALAGCMHIGEAATINPNGSSTEVFTMTISPALKSLSGGALTPKQLLQQQGQQEAKFKQEFPGQVAVSPYTDAKGWKGVKVVVKLKNLAELMKLETTTSGGTNGSGSSSGSPMFSPFSITHHGNLWSLLAKVDESGVALGGSGQGSGSLVSKQALEAMGMTFVISFKLPGRVVSSNATSKPSDGTLSWDMFKLKGTTLKGTWET
jgi:hypothetical protein